MQYENYHIAIGQVLRFFSREAGGYIFASAADQRLIRSFNESLMARAGEDGQKISLLFLRSDADELVMELITSYRLLADAQSELGQIAEAESAERNALALVKQQEATPGPETASAYHRLARLYLAKGALESALEYQHKALAIYQGLPKRYRAEQAASLSNAAYIYEHMGDIEQALHYQGQAVSILQAACPSDHQGLAAAKQAWQRMNEQLPT